MRQSTVVSLARRFGKALAGAAARTVDMVIAGTVPAAQPVLVPVRVKRSRDTSR